VFARNKYKAHGNAEFVANCIYMPLSDDGVDVYHILGVLRVEFGVQLDSGLWGGARLDPGEQYIVPITAIERWHPGVERLELG
jgi:hypothetical protein